jgi:hypothetical protein
MVWFDGRMNTFKQKDLEVVALKAIRDSETSSAAHKWVLAGPHRRQPIDRQH